MFRQSLLLAIAALLAACGKKETPTEGAQHFLTQISSNQIEKAYDEAAFGLRAEIGKERFIQGTRENGLAELRGFELAQPELKNGDFMISAEVTAKGGQKFPVVINVTEESGKWRVRSLRSPKGATVNGATIESRFAIGTYDIGVVDPLMRNPLPPRPECIEILSRTLGDFDAGVKSKSFTDFYQTFSKKWQGQVTEGMIQRAFQAFIDQNVDISSFKGLQPEFTQEPHITTDGLLVMAGYFETKPYRTLFSLKYYYEIPKWRLFGIDVSLADPTKKPAPEN